MALRIAPMPTKTIADGAQPAPPALELRQLSVTYQTAEGPVAAVRDVSLAIRQGEVLGIVGESGCGKSSLAFAVMGYLGGAGSASGEVLLAGENLLTKSPRALAAVRGSRLALVYQDPLSTLNPSLPVGEQIAEVYRTHRQAPRALAWERAVAMLGKVGLGQPEATARRYPHQLSGGQQQRVVIAMALCCEPDVLILDEPTTALDVTTQARVLDLVRDLQREFQTAALYISHNLAVIAQVCDRVAVMYAGQIVEEGPVGAMFRQPLHPYNVGLQGCVPRLGASKHDAPLRPIPGSLQSARRATDGCAFAARCGLARDICRQVAPPLDERQPGHRARCHFWADVPAWSAAQGPAVAAPRPADERLLAPAGSGATEAAAPLLTVQDLTKHYADDVGLLGQVLAAVSRRPRRPVRAVDGVSFAVPAGQTLALVGESGCGKTTLGRTIAGLTAATSGAITFAGADVTRLAERRSPEFRRQIQMVFQNPEASLNPRHTVGRALGRSLRRYQGLTGDAAQRRVAKLLAAVQLAPDYTARYPNQLSGGEKQRIAIARALAGEPRLVVLDEPVSALDVSVQAAVLNLLIDLQRQLGMTYLFVGHDLSVVRYIADWIAVIYLGQLCELSRADTLFTPPYHPYTEALLAAAPVPDPSVRQARIHLGGSVPSPQEPPRGCPFHTRCPRKVGAICETTPPPVRRDTAGRQLHCHIPPEELAAMQQPLGA